MLDAIFRGLGGLLVASVVGQFAAHAGIPAWQIGLMVLFVAVGLPMNKFRQLGFIDYNGHLEVHSSLLSVVLNDQLSTVVPPQ